MHSVMSMNSAAITATTMKTTRAAWPNLQRMDACSRNWRIQRSKETGQAGGLELRSSPLLDPFIAQSSWGVLTRVVQVTGLL